MTLLHIPTTILDLLLDIDNRLEAGDSPEGLRESLAPVIETVRRDFPGAAVDPTESIAISEPPAVSPFPKAGDEVFCFTRFRSRFWINPKGECEPAPWDEDSFFSRVSDSVFQFLISEEFTRAKLFAAAAEVGHCPAAPTAHEVETWARLWANPDESVGLGAEGVTRLRQMPETERTEDRRVHKLRVLLQAIRPSRTLTLQHGEDEEWVEKAGITTGSLRSIVQLLLLMGRSTPRPLEEVRRILAEEKVSVAHLVDDLAEARQTFHKFVVENFCLGGQVQRTHCRAAWDKFIGEVKPTLEMLYPQANGGHSSWDTGEIGERIEAFGKRYRTIANKGDVKLIDRKIMDNRSKRILELAGRVNDLLDQVSRARAEETPQEISEQDIIAKVRFFEDSTIPEDQFELACMQLVSRHLDPEAEPTPTPTFAFGAEDILVYPGLLGCVDAVRCDEARTIEFDDIVDPRRATALLFGEPRKPAGPKSERWFDPILDEHRDSGRRDLLAPLTPMLDRAEQSKIRRGRMTTLTDAIELVSKIRSIVERLGDLASTLGEPLRDVLDEAVRRLDEQEGGSAGSAGEELFLVGWLWHVHDHASKLLDHAVSQFRREVWDSSAPRRIEVLDVLAQERFADALFLWSASSEEAQVHAPEDRQTMWRDQALARFDDPLDAVHEMRDSLNTSIPKERELAELLEAWIDGLAGNPVKDSHIRTKFKTVAFAAQVGAKSRERLSNEGETKGHTFTMPAATLRRYLADQKLNPCFTPQLTKVDSLVLATPPVKFGPDFLEKSVEAVARHPRSLVGLLAPRMPREVRAEFLREVRKRGLYAGVIDDVDVCRLFAPSGRRGNLVIGLLEVLFEQQRWSDFSPFAPHEGSESKVEMFVGRTSEARDIAFSTKYSRLFSGRKLGKSALLKYVEDVHDGEDLPSGNTLRIVRIPIPGSTSESVVLHEIARELEQKVGFELKAEGPLTAERLLLELDGFLLERPKLSLLVVLDESDSFIESQLEAYAKSKEDCASFQMSRHSARRLDSHDFPRLRFLFAGYRKSNTIGGAWRNWNEVLRLSPLRADEASRFLAGPLARMGIDAIDIAPSIAYRCGYHPRMLQQFGQRLLETLEHEFPDVADGRRAVVTAEHVADVFEDKTIQQEIRTVIENNFDEEPASQLVFAAALLEFEPLAPGNPLFGAPQRIWKRIRDAVEACDEAKREALAKHDWLASSEAGREFVRDLLEVFVERKLLRPVERSSGTYSIQFPYHLPLLIEGAEARVRRALHQLATRNVDASKATDADPVSGRTIDDLNLVLVPAEQNAEDWFRAAILASYWPESIGNPDWLSDRFQFDPEHLATGFSGEDDEATKSAFLDLSAEQAESLLEVRPTDSKPALLSGGVDLFRWGARASLEGQDLIEVQGQGRLSSAFVERWFQRVREFELRQDHLDAIDSRTGRIPYLVRLVDESIRSAIGTDAGEQVGHAEFDQAMALYDERLPEHLRALVDGDDSVRLSDRERQLLRMVAVVARANGYSATNWLDDVRAEVWETGLFEDAWKEMFPESAYPQGWTGLFDDEIARRVLEKTGFLPHPLDFVPTEGDAIPETDPLFTVIVPARTGEEVIR